MPGKHTRDCVTSPPPNWDFKESFQTPWAKFPQGSEAKKQRGQRGVAETFPLLCSLGAGMQGGLRSMQGMWNQGALGQLTELLPDSKWLTSLLMTPACPFVACPSPTSISCLASFCQGQ